MAMNKLAVETVSQIREVLPNPLTEEQSKALSKIIEQALSEAVLHTSKRCSSAAVICCGPEADMAHKIAEQVQRERHALIANLMGPR